jgi:Xaa-Pro aminopeptidase
MTGIATKAEIAASEFAERRTRAAEEARSIGLDALLVCARGGGALDRYADVMYLANHYSAFPFIPDLEGKWTGRAHSFVILPASGDALLLTDMPAVAGQSGLRPEQIVVSGLVIEALIESLRNTGLAKAKIGLVGGDILPTSMFRTIASALPEITWSEADDILARLRAVKSAGEIECLRAASKLGSRMMDAMMEAAEPGTAHGDIVAAGMQVLVPAGGILYNSFMSSGTGGDNPTKTTAAFPTWSAPTPVRKGDWFRVGISGVLNGYYFDLARARPIGPPSNRQIDAFEAAIAVVDEGIGAVRPGATASEVAEAGRRKQEALGYPMGNSFGGLGHGIGLGWDAPWLVGEDHTKLVASMVLCLERTVMLDGFCGDFEETVLVTASGSELLTDARIRRW